MVPRRRDVPGVPGQVCRFARSSKAAERTVPEWSVCGNWASAVEGTGPDAAHQFHGGDLDAVTEKIDVLTGLGVGMVYPIPFIPARSKHDYDASTFNARDLLMGGGRALIGLVQAAHARGMKVLGGLSSNHTGHAHRCFTRAHAP